jgi:hypothetical protein
MPDRRKSTAANDSSGIGWIDPDIDNDHAAYFPVAMHRAAGVERGIATNRMNASSGPLRDVDLCWRWSGAECATEGCQEGERGSDLIPGDQSQGNANLAKAQHQSNKLAPLAMTCLVRANGSMSTNQPCQGNICRDIMEDDLVECMVARGFRVLIRIMKSSNNLTSLSRYYSTNRSSENSAARQCML